MKYSEETKITKEQSNRLLYRIYRLLESDEFCVKFKSMHWGMVGQFDPSTNIAQINPKNDILPVVIHEALHALYPDESLDISDGTCSSKVFILEQQMCSRLSTKQWENLFLRVADNLLRSHVE